MPKNIVFCQVYTGVKAYVDNLLYFLYISDLPNPNTELVVVEVGEPLGSIKLLFPEVIFVSAANKNLDFGAYSQVIEAIDTSGYSMFMFINCTVRGPFMGLDSTKNWFDVFTSELGGSVQLVGPTINMLPLDSEFGLAAEKKFGAKDFYPHVQSMAFALGREGMDLLLEKGFWSLGKRKSKVDVIVDYEIGLSQILLEHGYAIKSLLPKPGEIRSDSTLHPLANSRSGDVNFRGAYEGRTLSPYELIFVKTNRNMISRRKLRKISRDEIRSKQPGKSGHNQLMEDLLSNRKVI